MLILPPFRPFMAMLNPCPSSPSRLATGTAQSSNITARVGWEFQPTWRTEGHAREQDRELLLPSSGPARKLVLVKNKKYPSPFFLFCQSWDPAFPSPPPDRRCPSALWLPFCTSRCRRLCLPLRWWRPERRSRSKNKQTGSHWITSPLWGSPWSRSGCSGRLSAAQRSEAKLHHCRCLRSKKDFRKRLKTLKIQFFSKMREVFFFSFSFFLLVPLFRKCVLNMHFCKSALYDVIKCTETTGAKPNKKCHF